MGLYILAFIVLFACNVTALFVVDASYGHVKRNNVLTIVGILIAGIGGMLTMGLLS